MKNTPYDYSDERVRVYFEIGGIDEKKDGTGKKIKDIIEGLDYIDKLEYAQYGFYVSIAIQQIPSVVYDLTTENIAIYSVERKNKIISN